MTDLESDTISVTRTGTPFTKPLEKQQKDATESGGRNQTNFTIASVSDPGPSNKSINVIPPKRKRTDVTIKFDAADENKLASGDKANKISPSGNNEEGEFVSSEWREPEEIIKVTRYNGKLFYLLKWKDTEESTNDSDIISCTEASALCPNLVIEYLTRNSKLV